MKFYVITNPTQPQGSNFDFNYESTFTDYF